MKLFTVTKTMSTESTSETKFYMDFEPLTFGQWINKPKMAYSRDAFIRDKQETRERWDKSETR